VHTVQIFLSAIAVLSFLLSLSACNGLVPPRPQKMATIIDDKGHRSVTVDEAIKAAGFHPVYPSSLLINKSLEPEITARNFQGQPASLELHYEAEKLGILIRETLDSRTIKVPTYSTVEIGGQTVFYELRPFPAPASTNSEFLASWNQESISFWMQIIWPGRPPDGSPEDKLRQDAALDIVRSMIQAGNQS